MIEWILIGICILAGFITYQHRLEMAKVKRCHERIEKQMINGELSPGACFISYHDFGHWRGRIYGWFDILHMRLIAKHFWIIKLKMEFKSFIKPIRFEKNGDITQGYIFMPWTRKVTGKHHGCNIAVFR